MAADDKSEMEEQLCCIEASVVTGFEECARGEARELFNTTVKAARGKITWKVPINRVKEVVQMGSIDNCRVVIHSVPHFGFTDQHDSLARLQKMIGELDWEQGLQVWRQFNDFPHDIASKPDVVPSLEELVDVVIIKNRTQHPKSSKKKGGRWKKDKKGKKENSKDEGKQDAPIQEGNEDIPDISGCDIGKGKEDGLNLTSVTTKGARELPKSTIDEHGTKRVFVKQTDPNEPKPEIEIKVLIPGPNESVFPIDLDDGDQRQVEPMDVDKSVLHHPDASPSKSKGQGTEDAGEHFKEHSSPPEPRSLSSPVKQSSAAINILSSARDFASSVIERLKSPPGAPSELSTSPSCVTPPPTPVQNSLDLFMKSKWDGVKSTSVDGCGTSQDNNNEDKSPGGLTAKSSLSNTSSSVDGEVNPLGIEKENSNLNSNDTKLSPVAVKSENCTTLCDGPSKETVKGECVESKSAVKKERDPTKPTFRVTCNRNGDNHAFDSSSAAACLGSAIITYFKWSVDLKKFDIEVLLNIDNEEVTVGLAITKSSLHNRNLVAFGPTTLRATICFNMMRLCRIRNGDFVCDPMCGTSAIPIEGCLKWKHCFFFGGDYHEKGIERSLQNVNALREKRLEEKKDSMKIDTVQWNIEHFPLRDKSVDVFVSDLPFGYRMGSRTTNRTLYPSLLDAMARTARTGARACLLTEDKTSLIKAIQALNGLWQRRVILSINMGGLSGFVFLLTRTTAAYASKRETSSPGCEGDTEISTGQEGSGTGGKSAQDEVGGGDGALSDVVQAEVRGESVAEAAPGPDSC